MAASSFELSKKKNYYTSVGPDCPRNCLLCTDGFGAGYNCCSKLGNLCVLSYCGQGYREVRRTDAIQEVATSDTLKTETKA